MANTWLFLQCLWWSFRLSLHYFRLYFMRTSYQTTQLALLFLTLLCLVTFHFLWALLSFLVLHLVILLPYLPLDTPQVLHSPSPLADRLVSCLSLKPFRLPLPIAFGATQSILVGGRFGLPMEYEREPINTPDGGYFVLDWLKHPTDLDPASPILVIYHGLAGGSRESYVGRISYYAQQKGYRVVVFTNRGCAGTRLQGVPRAYSSTCLGDTLVSIEHIAQKYPNAPVVCVGYSLGGMLTTQLAARIDQFALKHNVIGCVSISPTWTSLLTTGVIPQTFMEKFCSSLAHIILKNEAFIDECLQNKSLVNFDFGVLRKGCHEKTVQAFDQFFNSKIFKYGDFTTYYYDIEQWYHLLPSSRMPLLTLNAEDDPIALMNPDSACRVANVVSRSENMIAITTYSGGHLGWINGKKSSKGWDDTLVLEYADELVALFHEQKLTHLTK